MSNLAPNYHDLSTAAAKRSWTGVLVLIESLALLSVTAVWAGPLLFSAGKVSLPLLVASSVLLCLEAVTLLAISGVRAMARQTFAQCIRTKIGLLFMVLLVVMLCLLPAIAKGDGTLAGKIRTFLSWSMSLTLVLVSVVTIFLGCSVISSDVSNKQIFITATKPLPRWQYMIGRWLGVVMLGLVLLAGASVAIYAVAEHLRTQPAFSGQDRRAIETEVFTARGRIRPDPDPNFDINVKGEMERLHRENAYAGALEAWKSRTGGDEELAAQRLIDELRKQVSQRGGSAAPRGGLTWTFSHVGVAGQEFVAPCTVLEANAALRLLRVRAEPRVLRKLQQDYPVLLNNSPCRVMGVEAGACLLRFPPEAFDGQGLGLLVNQEAKIVLEPVLQLTFRATATGDLPTERQADGQELPMIESLWEIENPGTGGRQWMPRRDPLGRPITLTISARAVSQDGRMVVRFTNMTTSSVQIDRDDMALLFSEDTFEWNFVRVCLLMALQLVFLAAIGILAGSILSFPVAVLSCLTLLPFTMARVFLVDAVKYTPGYSDFITGVGHYIFAVMAVILPDFASTWRSDMLVEGLIVPWDGVGLTAVVTIGLRCLVVMALGCALFRRRELARVQV